jgi:hypothetical protein
MRHEDQALPGSVSDGYLARPRGGVIRVRKRRREGVEKTPDASSKDTPCFWRLILAFAALHS